MMDILAKKNGVWHINCRETVTLVAGTAYSLPDKLANDIISNGYGVLLDDKTRDKLDRKEEIDDIKSRKSLQKSTENKSLKDDFENKETFIGEE